MLISLLFGSEYNPIIHSHFLCSFQEPLDEEDEDEKDPNPPMMVPIADMLNHVSNHNANLEYTPVSKTPLQLTFCSLILYSGCIARIWYVLFLSAFTGVFEDGVSAKHPERRGSVQHIWSDGQLAAPTHVWLCRAISKQ